MDIVSNIFQSPKWNSLILGLFVACLGPKWWAFHGLWEEGYNISQLEDYLKKFKKKKKEESSFAKKKSFKEKNLL